MLGVRKIHILKDPESQYNKGTRFFFNYLFEILRKHGHKNSATWTQTKIN